MTEKIQTCKWCKKTSEDFESNGTRVYFDNDSAQQCKTCRNGRARYGLDRLQQIELLESQNNKCYLCDYPLRLFIGRWSNKNSEAAQIDHDHKTNEVRGIICRPCNVLLGVLESRGNVNSYLENVKKYLLKESMIRKVNKNGT